LSDDKPTTRTAVTRWPWTDATSHSNFQWVSWNGPHFSL